MWDFDDKNKFLYFVSKNFVFNPSVAITSLNNTLIVDDVKKEKIPYMKLYDNSVIDFLKQVNENGSIVIIDNMVGCAQTTIKLGISSFFKLINNDQNNIPFIIIFPLRNNRFKKPYKHIFNKLQDIYKAHSTEIIDLATSIVIGNNAGRLKTQSYPADLSDCDRAFAYNIGISTFRTPDEVFRDETITRQWCWNFDQKIITTYVDQCKIKVEPKFNHMFDINQKSIIFLTGPPSSGKTLLSRRIKREFYDKNYDSNNEKNTDCTIIDINNFSSEFYMLECFKNTLKNNSIDSLIVVGDLSNDTNRNKFFLILKETESIENYFIKIVEIDTTKNICEYLNSFSLMISKTSVELHNRYIFTNYFTYYKAISVDYVKSQFADYLNKFSVFKFPLILRDEKVMMSYRY
jgi:hypothetical protein